jgi:RNA polymerase sigma-70 factor (ECF subfamily)
LAPAGTRAGRRLGTEGGRGAARTADPCGADRTVERPGAGTRLRESQARLPQDSGVVPAQSTTGPPSEAEPPKYPARPDPGDAAAEVWALVERAQAGESAAFGLIYDRYVDTVFRFVYFRVGNRQLAEDLTSDTFLRALKRIGSFTWQGPFRVRTHERRPHARQ